MHKYIAEIAGLRMSAIPAARTRAKGFHKISEIHGIQEIPDRTVLSLLKFFWAVVDAIELGRGQKPYGGYQLSATAELPAMRLPAVVVPRVA